VFYFTCNTLKVVTCEIKCWDCFKIISKSFYFTCNHSVTVKTFCSGE